MRIIAGRFRSRRLETVPGISVRPTSDRLRETLFSVLAPRIEGSVFVDAYAGSGAVGLEAVSRGAQRVVLIEKSSAALDVLRQNIGALQVGDEVRVVRGRAAAVLPQYPADIIFVDPPYEATSEYDASLSAARLLSGGVLVAQHTSRFAPPQEVGGLRATRVLKQGDNSLTFYEVTASAL